MDRLLHDLSWVQCLVYFDDILIYANSFDQMCKRLTNVLQKFLEANIKIRPSKCIFATLKSSLRKESTEYSLFLVARNRFKTAFRSKMIAYYEEKSDFSKNGPVKSWNFLKSVVQTKKSVSNGPILTLKTDVGVITKESKIDI